MKTKINHIANHIVNWYIKEKRILALSLAIGLIVTFTAGFATKLYSDHIVNGISSKVIRFHVLANSDADIDQNLKLKVRDAILDEYSDCLNTSQSIAETREILLTNIAGIESTAARVVEAEGFHYTVSASLAKDMFPTKKYGDIALPAGEYEALRVEIGEAAGQNWWCVMFPPLCYIDVAKSEVDPEFKEQLKISLTDEQYQLVDTTYAEEDEQIKVKFKIVEWWQKQKQDDASTIITVKNQ